MATQLKLDTHAALTTDRAASSYGVPVLVDDRYDGPRGADDALHRGTEMTGAEYVGHMYRVGDTLPTLTRAYLQSARAPMLMHVVHLLAGTHRLPESAS